jgi:hypothetical protein
MQHSTAIRGGVIVSGNSNKLSLHSNNTNDVIRSNFSEIIRLIGLSQEANQTAYNNLTQEIRSIREEIRSIREEVRENSERFSELGAKVEPLVLPYKVSEVDQDTGIRYSVQQFDAYFDETNPHNGFERIIRQAVLSWPIGNEIL